MKIANIADTERVLGREEGLIYRQNLVQTYLNVGRSEAAVLEAEVTAGIADQVLGSDDPRRIEIYAMKGDALSNVRRYEDAVISFRVAQALSERLNGAEAEITLFYANAVAFALSGLGKYEDALAIYTRLAEPWQRIGSVRFQSKLSLLVAGSSTAQGIAWP